MIEKWFETPICYSFIEGDDFSCVQNEIANYLKQHPTYNFQKHPQFGSSNHKLSDYKFENNLIKNYKMTHLENCIKKQTQLFLQNLSGTKFNTSIQTSWLTSTQNKEHSIVHHHSTYDLAGVYYYKTNTQDGELFFINPCMSLVSSYFLSADQIVAYPPQEGKLIIFPAWLQHGVKTNETDNERISLSFNIDVHITESPI